MGYGHQHMRHPIGEEPSARETPYWVRVISMLDTLMEYGHQHMRHPIGIVSSAAGKDPIRIGSSERETPYWDRFISST